MLLPFRYNLRQTPLCRLIFWCGKQYVDFDSCGFGAYPSPGKMELKKEIYFVQCLHSIQRWALPIEFRYYDIPIAIGLSNSYRNIGLTYLSDFNYLTSYIGLRIVRYLSDLLKLPDKKMDNFLSFYVFLDEFFAVLMTFWWISANICELLASILCCWRPC